MIKLGGHNFYIWWLELFHPRDQNPSGNSKGPRVLTLCRKGSSDDHFDESMGRDRPKFL